jgi:diketogulonate reductase-like aldo/keto reductase
MPRIHLGVYMTSGRETETMVSQALEAGYRAFDSAEWYANEKQVGSAILKYMEEKNVARENIWFTTKLKDNRGYNETRKKIKESIKRSGLGYIDLYLLHSPYGGARMRRECWRAVEDAVGAGEVKAGGVSNFGVRHVSSCLPLASQLPVERCESRIRNC